MRKLKTPKLMLSLTLISLLFAGPVANAQDAEIEAEGSATSPSVADKIRAGVFLGGNYLSSENELGNSFHSDQVPGSGFLLGLRASYLLLDSIVPESAIDPQLELELEGKFTFSSTEGREGRASLSTPVAGWRVNALVDLYPSNKVVPFVLLGAGGETVFGSNRFMTSPDTDFAWYGGAGLRYPVASHIDLRGDLRVGMTASRVDSVSSLAEVHLGVSYRFGSSAKAAPMEEVVDIMADPEEPKILDGDRDGVPDEDDDCPDLAEILNGIDDEDGCPEVDSDNDGLLGSKDQCPAAAEDVDGTDDDDGCPDPDNDKDGRPDVIDQCPNEAENLNGYEDEDGCPDEIPAQVQAFTGTIEGIVFRTASARILPKSRRTLDKAFKLLEKHPSIRIEISGHTDDQGNAESNRTLSRKRADYVKWYLVDKGIDASRILTVGKGPDVPVGDNDTAAGRQKNRRIEFRLLPGEATVTGPAAAGAPAAEPMAPAATIPVPAPKEPSVPVPAPKKPGKP